MIPLFCQWIDRMAIHLAAARMPKPDGRDLHLEEAGRLLQNLDFSPAEMEPAAIEFERPDKLPVCQSAPQRACCQQCCSWPVVSVRRPLAAKTGGSAPAWLE